MTDFFGVPRPVVAILAAGSRLRRRCAPVALLAGALVLILPVAAASADPPATVGLGTAGSFSVLAGSAVTNTGPTVVSADAGEGGDLGVSPGSAVTGFPPGSVDAPGTIHAADAVAANAEAALTTGYNDAAGRPCDSNLTGQDLGGLTETTGTYCFSTSAQLTGALTLNGQGDPGAVFIFQIGSTLTTASASSVLLTNGAQACNVFWQVGSSATLGTATAFSGNVLALTSISANTSADVEGRLLARNGAVTLDSNTIHTPACAPSSGVSQAPIFGVAGFAVAAGVFFATAVVFYRRRTRRFVTA